MEEGALKINDGAETLMEKALTEMRKDEPTVNWKTWEEKMHNYHTYWIHRGLWDEDAAF